MDQLEINVCVGCVQNLDVFLIREVAGFAVTISVKVLGESVSEFIDGQAAVATFIRYSISIVVVGRAVQNVTIVEDAVAVAVACISFASIANAILVAVALVTVWCVGTVVAAVGDAVAVDITQGVVGKQDGGVRSGHIDRDIVHPSEVAGFVTGIEAAFNHQAVAGATVGVKGPRVAHLLPADIRGVRGVATR